MRVLDYGDILYFHAAYSTLKQPLCPAFHCRRYTVHCTIWKSRLILTSNKKRTTHYLSIQVSISLSHLFLNQIPGLVNSCPPSSKYWTWEDCPPVFFTKIMDWITNDLNVSPMWMNFNLTFWTLLCVCCWYCLYVLVCDCLCFVVVCLITALFLLPYRKAIGNIVWEPWMFAQHFMAIH